MRFRHLFLLVILFVSSCSKNNTINIAYVSTLTGRNSEAGVLGRKGVEMAVRKINESGGVHGKKIELVTMNDKFNTDTALYADSILIEQGIKYFIGHSMSSVIEKPIKYIRDKDVIFISPTVSTISISNQDDNFFRVVSSNALQAKALAKFIKTRDDVRKLGVIYELKNKLYTLELLNEFETLFNSYGGEIIIKKSYEINEDISFYDLSKTILESGVDGILILAPGFDNAIICQNIMKQKPELPIFTGLWSMTNDFISIGGKAVQNVYLAGAVNIFEPSENMLKHITEFREIFGIEPTFSSTYSYEAATVLFEAMNISKDLSTASIKKVLLNNSFKGIDKEIKFNQYGDSQKEYDIYIIKNGKFVKYQKNE